VCALQIFKFLLSLSYLQTFSSSTSWGRQELSCHRESRPLHCFLTHRHRFRKIPIPTFEIRRLPIPAVI